MKKSIMGLVFCLSLLMSGCSDQQVSDMSKPSQIAGQSKIVVLTDALQERYHSPVFDQVVNLIGNSHVNDHLLILGPQGEDIATFVVPNLPRLRRQPELIRTKYVKADEVTHELLKLRNFLKRRKRHNDNRLNIPAIARVLGEIKAGSEKQVQVILVGAPWHYSNAYASITEKGRVPSHAHLALRSKDSEYGTADLKSLLHGVSIHLGSTDVNYISLPHKDALAEWWAVYVQSLGGGFSIGSIDRAFKAALQNRTSSARKYEIDLSHTKPEMIDFSPSPRLYFERSRASVVSVSPVIKKSKKTEPIDAIAIRWREKVDIDLWLKSRGEEISYKYPFSPRLGAQHTKFGPDQSDSRIRGYERIYLNKPLSLDAEVSLNHYSGDAAGPVSVEIAVRKGNLIFLTKAKVPTSQGRNKNWVHFSLRDLLSRREFWELPNG